MASKMTVMMPGFGANLPKAASTPEGLADQLHEKLTTQSGFIFGDPIDRALNKHKQKSSFIESKNVLAILQSDIGATPERFLGVLNKLKYKDTIKYIHLYPVPSWSEKDRPFDFAKFSEQVAEHLPNFEFLRVMHMLILNFRIESTTIKRLILMGPQPKDKEWELKCPNLVELEMQNHTPPVKNFQRALINCPRIETYFSHKYWNEEPLPDLYLPKCTKFTFRRGDTTSSLKLYLPRVKELTLDGCFNLKNVELLTQGHADHAELNKGSELSKFRLSLTNSNLSTQALKSLRGTGRVTNPNAFRQARDEDAGVGMDAFFASMSRMMR